MDIENLQDVWEAGGRLYARCEKPRSEGLKLVRPCSNQYELDVRTMLWTRGRDFPVSMLSSRMRGEMGLLAERLLDTPPSAQFVELPFADGFGDARTGSDAAFRDSPQWAGSSRSALRS